MNISKDIRIPSSLLFVGKSNSGKTYLIKYMLIELCKKRKFQFGLVFTNTKFKNYFDFLPDKYVIDCQFDLEKVENVLKNYLKKLKQIHYQKPVIKAQRKRGIESNVPNSFIVFDDCYGIIKQETPFFKQFLATYRHYNVSLFINVQKITGVSTLWREQVDYAFIFRVKNLTSIRAIFEWFGQDFDSLKEFKDKFMSITSQDHTCMIYIDSVDNDKNHLQYKAPYPLKVLKINY